MGMATETVAMVGTRKGLWIGRSDERRETWSWDGPHFDMQEVYSCMIDTRGGRTRLLAGAASSWVGPQVGYSDDLGGSWEHGPDGGIRFPADTDASVERIWQLQPGIEPSFEGRHPLRVAGHEQDPGRRVSARGAKRQLAAVHLRKDHIGQQQIDGIGDVGQEEQCLFRIGRLQHLIAKPLQHGLRKSPDRILVFHEQNRLGPGC